MRKKLLVFPVFIILMELEMYLTSNMMFCVSACVCGDSIYFSTRKRGLKYALVVEVAYGNPM